MPTSETGITSTRSGTAKSSARAEALRLEGLSFAFGPGPAAVEGVSLSVERGALFALLGPSGCGKTTLLRLLGGYLAPRSGAAFLDGRDVTGLPPERRDIGMVFQNYALFPHLSADDNIAFGLEMRGVPRAERRRRATTMRERVGLTTEEGRRYPRELSGGQQQRVALARALVIEPRLLLLDEPLANLDRGLREQLRGELRELQRRTGVTTLLVTHDQEEALALADRVGLMAAGRILQEDAPRELYRRPCCPFAARFLGDANLLRIEAVTGGVLHLAGGLSLPVTPEDGLTSARPGNWLMLRPELAGLGAAGAPRSWSGIVAGVSYLGADCVLTVAVGNSAVLRVRCRAGDAERLPPGAAAAVVVPEGAVWPIPEDDPPWLAAGKREGRP
jgi:ABC-type Fe3+/spermidine/putrescine transport system ATPase subunit